MLRRSAAPERGTWMAVVEQESLRRAGIDASLKPCSLALFNAPNGPLRSGNFLLASTWWIGGADPDRGSGLIGLTDRVDALGGSISISSAAGQGTAINVKLPIEGQ